MAYLLGCENVHLEYPTKKVFDSVTLGIDEGDRVGIVGGNGDGKSSLLAALTHAHPEIADYPFTTRSPIPGMMEHQGVQVQLVDTPAVAPGHAESWLPALVGGADGVLLVIDVGNDATPAHAQAAVEVMQRGHVWPAGHPFPPDASPLLAPRPTLVVGTKCDQDEQHREYVTQGIPRGRFGAWRHLQCSAGC